MTLPIMVASIAGDRASVADAHRTIVDRLGHPEVLVYNAGPGGFAWPPPSILDTPADKFAQGFNAGVTGALLWIQQVRRLLPCVASSCKADQSITWALPGYKIALLVVRGLMYP